MIEDIGTLQNMVKKRDEIIAKLKEAKVSKYVLPEELKIKPTDSDIDYREVCEQLKAATGEITRLQGLLAEDESLVVEITRLEEKNTQYNTEMQKLYNEVDSLTESVKTLQSQLDQECNSNAELEDKLKESKVLPIISVDIQLQEQIKAATGEITRLEDLLLIKDDLHESCKKELSKQILDRADFTLTIEKLEKQLDQECNSNAELEDNNDADYKEVCRLLDVETKKLLKAVEEKSLLEEKLALCDKYHNRHMKKLQMISDIALRDAQLALPKLVYDS